MSTATLKLSEHRPPHPVPAEEFVKFAARLHRSLETRDVAAAVAEGGRLWTRWDRITVLSRHGWSWRIVATSGQSVLASKSPTSLRLNHLVRQWLKAPRSWVHDQRQPSPLSAAMTTAVTEYLAVAAPCHMQIEPVFATAPEAPSVNQPKDRRRGQPIAVVVFEDFQHRGEDPAREDRTQSLIDQATLALTHAWNVRHIPLRGWLIALGECWQWWTTSRLVLAGGLLMLLWAAASWCMSVPADLQIHATGQLIAKQHRRVFAPVEGEVVELLVSTGDRVTAGQPLLRLWDMTLHQDLAQNRSRISEVQQSLEGTKAELHELLRGTGDAAEQARLQTRMTQQQIEIQGLHQQGKLLEDATRRLIVTAPMAGLVTTTNLQDRLAQRPVGRGDLLLELADETQGWQLDLLVPEAEFGKFQRTAQPVEPQTTSVEFRLIAQPQQVYQALVTDVAPRTVDVPDIGPCIPVSATVTEIDPAAGTWGADVEARLVGPRAPLAETLFGDLIDALYRWSWW